ncbi:MAG TPA: glycerol-3-phosphate dehydrogenase [Thiolinea sp.]|nr:glycerol-3-phosphate dehydrogenase [Thiolinea sp.]
MSKPAETVPDTVFDIAIIGGGINGCGIARDAAGRGLSVLLAEQGDLAQGTSSASTKLIHGGLRYLEHYEFRLVREALSEREVLWQNAPHIIRPLRFVLPYHKGLRPAWLLRLGLFIYDHLGGRKRLPPTRTLDLRTDPVGKPLNTDFSKGFEYSDCWVDDARLVVLNALDAAARGARILTRTRCSAARRENGLWQVQLTDQDRGETRTIQARMLVNAAGPWVDHVLEALQLKHSGTAHVRLVRGSHVIVPKLYEHERAYIFQNQDGRIIFAIPYEQHFTLLGTTDADHQGALDSVRITAEETRYICAAASEYFRTPIDPETVVWSYSGVRPLYNDGAGAAQEATRDYVLKVSDVDGKAPLLNIFGGKITTYRRLAEDALHKLTAYTTAAGPAWTAQAALPGGRFGVDEVRTQTERLQQDYPFVSDDQAVSLIRRYGLRAWELLVDAKKSEDMGRAFGVGLTEREVIFLVRQEWARQADDILWRRSKLGLHMTEAQRNAFRDWFTEHYHAMLDREVA